MKAYQTHRNEGRRLLGLTGPIILAQLSQTAMGVVDTIMAGRVSAVDLAAVAVGSSIFFPLFLFMVGTLSAVTPLVAQGHGRGDNLAVGNAIRQGMVAGLGLGLIMLFLLHQLTPIMAWMGVSAEVMPLTGQYLSAVSWGLPAAGAFLALRNGGDGLSKPRLSMFAGFFGLLVNICANYILIYGKLGFPAMGGVGCGYATSLSMVAMLAAMGLMLQRSSTVQGSLFRLANLHTLRSLGPLLVLGLPIGLSLFVECSIFAVIALLVSKLGAEVVAAHQIALNFTSLLFMLPYSLSTALSVRVGFAIGRNQANQVKITVQAGLALALLCACCTCLFILLAADQIAALYSPDPTVRQLAATLLGLAALFQIPDSLQVNSAGALRGCKDTTVPMVLMVVAYWGVGLPIGYGLGLKGLAGMTPGPQGFWIGLICGLSMAATLLSFRLYAIVRRQMTA